MNSPLHSDVSATPAKLDSRKHRVLIAVLLLLPVAGLIFPPLYNRESPALLGFPFFYWYQLLWVVLTTAILGIVYKLGKD